MARCKRVLCNPNYYAEIISDLDYFIKYQCEILYFLNCKI